MAATPSSRRTLLFSATLDRKVMQSVSSILKDPAFVEVSHKGETAGHHRPVHDPRRPDEEARAAAPRAPAAGEQARHRSPTRRRAPRYAPAS
ncbi:MAG: hypothetical protein ACLSVD_07860 [Eggerthellaceae bacterium]